MPTYVDTQEEEPGDRQGNPVLASQSETNSDHLNLHQDSFAKSSGDL